MKMTMTKAWAVATGLGLLFVILLGLLTGCTDNIRSRNFGGSMTITLPAGEKFVNATWKNAELWYLTRKSSTNETAETYVFHEKSSFGMMEGTVTFVETK